MFDVGARRGWARLGLASFAGVLGVGLGFGVVVGACSSDAVPEVVGDASVDGSPSGDTDVSAPPSDASTGAAPFGSYRSGGRLRAEVLRAGDAVRFEQFFDTKRNESCSFWETNPGEYRCLPLWTVAKYTDGTCGTPAVAHLSSCTPDIKYAVVTVAPTGCTAQRAVAAIHPVGDVADGATYERLVDGQCTQAIPSEGMTRRTLGPEIPLTEFVKATNAPANVTADLAASSVCSAKTAASSPAIASSTAAATLGADMGGRRPGATSIACIPNPPFYAFEKSGPWANASCTALAARTFGLADCSPGWWSCDNARSTEASAHGV